jgi:outer membrane protein assembly factor BamB
VRASVTALAVTVSPDGSAAYVLARNRNAAAQVAFVVLAYNATTGAHLWTSELAGPSTDSDYANTITSSADGVYATGYTEEPPVGKDNFLMTTVAIQP